jgi:hypothetical protein
MTAGMSTEKYECPNCGHDILRQIVRWIVLNVDANVVPGDEGNGDALIYNMVHLAKEGPTYRHYDYDELQDAEIEALKKRYGLKE